MNVGGRTDEAAHDGRLTARFAALAHPARLRILRHLAGCDACCCKDVVERVGLAQSTVSQHLRILVDAGLVRYRPDSRRSCYSLDAEALAELSGDMAALVKSCCGRTTG